MQAHLYDVVTSPFTLIASTRSLTKNQSHDLIIPLVWLPCHKNEGRVFNL